MLFLFGALAAFLASILTFFTGFGLGTVLLGVFVIFFPVNFAIAATAVVHLSNNMLKILLVGKHCKREVFLKFGIPALLAAAAGAFALTKLEGIQTVYSYELFAKHLQTTPVRCLIGVLMAGFAAIDLFGLSEKWQIESKWMPLGGILSGFFGGLSGNQGAFRTMFLLKSGLQKEQLIGTGAAIGCLVDIGRISIYWTQIQGPLLVSNAPLLGTSIAAAILGTLIGNKLLKKVSLRNIEIAASILLLAIAIGLAAGLF